MATPEQPVPNSEPGSVPTSELPVLGDPTQWTPPKSVAGTPPQAGHQPTLQASAPVDDESLGWTDHEFLWRYLRARDDQCPLCHYNLRGLLSDKCPECGAALRLQVSLVEVYLKPWITLLVTIGMAGGVGLLFLIALIAQGGPPPSRFLMMYGCYGAIAAIPMAVIVLVARRAMMRLPRNNQWLIAAIGAAYAASIFGAFTISVVLQR